MMNAIAGALAAVEPEDQAALAEWGVGRLLIALAKLRGFRFAAGLAYRMADLLATVR